MGPKWGGVRVLIVEDQHHMRAILKTVLREFGIGHVEEAGSVDDGLEILKRATTDIVLLDYLLGDKTGLDFLRAVRGGEGVPNPFLPIIIVTAHSDKDRVFALRDAGATEFLTKPLVPAHLFRRLQMAIEEPRPFVRSESYFGPDRRRHNGQFHSGAERRQEVTQSA